MPRLLTAEASARLAAGAEQRVRALNAYAVDAYGDRRIVAAGRLPEWIIESSEGYEPALRGRWPGGPAPIGVAGAGSRPHARRLAPRHVDLRPYVFSAPGWTRAVPAGLTRVAWEEGALVVNSSQNGGAKVTWALR